MRYKYRYLIVIMLTFITMINYIDRGAIAYAQEFIIKEFGFNVQTWGQVLGYFGYGYIFGGFFGGLLADKKGPKYAWLLSAGAWSVFEMITGFAGDIGLAVFGGSALAGFAVFRVLFGFTEGPGFAALNRTIANWSAPKEKAFLASFGHLGVPLGAAVTAPIAVFLISLAGWKMMFVILGALGLIWAAVWAKMFTDQPEDHPRVSKEELAEIRFSQGLSDATRNNAKEFRIPWYHFFKNPNLVLNSIGSFALSYINFLILTWSPKYLQDVFHIKLSSLGYLGVIPWIGACFAVPIGSRLSDFLLLKTNSIRIARCGICCISFFLTALFFVLILAVDSPAAVLTLMSLGTTSAFLSSTLYWTIVIDTEPSKAGTFTGVHHFIVNISSIVAPTLTGYLVAGYGYTAMFIAAVVVALIGAVVMTFVKPGERKRIDPFSGNQQSSVNS